MSALFVEKKEPPGDDGTYRKVFFGRIRTGRSL